MPKNRIRVEMKKNALGEWEVSFKVGTMECVMYAGVNFKAALDRFVLTAQVLRANRKLFEGEE